MKAKVVSGVFVLSTIALFFYISGAHFVSVLEATLVTLTIFFLVLSGIRWLFR